MTNRWRRFYGLTLIAGAVASAVTTWVFLPGTDVYGSVLFLGLGVGLAVSR